ncbi:MAG: type II toxin-antitoxin system RelE/ParE family toxin [Alphaproteobacteria bacterium]
MKLRFTHRALRDVAEIAEFIRRENPDAALRVRDAILGSLETVRQFPEIGRLQNVESVRKLVVRRFPYLIYYSIDSDHAAIVVLTVQHAARRRIHEDR